MATDHRGSNFIHAGKRTSDDTKSAVDKFFGVLEGHYEQKASYEDSKQKFHRSGGVGRLSGYRHHFPEFPDLGLDDAWNTALENRENNDAV